MAFDGFTSDTAKARFYEVILDLIAKTPHANPEQTAALAKDALNFGAMGVGVANDATH